MHIRRRIVGRAQSAGDVGSGSSVRKGGAAVEKKSATTAAKEVEVIFDAAHDGMIAVDEKGVVKLFNKPAAPLLEAIFKSTQDAISVVDEQGLGLFINPAYTRLTGLTEADVIGKPPTIDIAEGESMHLQVLRTRRPVRGARMKVGPQKKDVIVHVAPIIVGDKLKGSVAVIHDTSEIRRLTEELDMAKERLRRQGAKYTFEDIIGRSPTFTQAIEQARRVADTSATVLLAGESGTGKELFAHAIHYVSRRRYRPLVRVNCLAIADSLLESELFGYVDGAFTGAKRGGKRGLFEEADGGTLFLDEIGEMNVTLQAKLLRVLQEKEIVRVGDATPLPVDVRVIAATNRNLEQAVRDGSFREDLYYRLNMVPIRIPPLRERREDIPPLVHALIRKFNQEFERNVEGISGVALVTLESYGWPGNVRELENVIGRAMLNMRDIQAILELEHLPSLVFTHSPVGPPVAAFGAGRPAVDAAGLDFGTRDGESGGGALLKDSAACAERATIQAALARNGSNRARAAAELGISVRTLYYKLKKLALQ